LASWKRISCRLLFCSVSRRATTTWRGMDTCSPCRSHLVCPSCLCKGEGMDAEHGRSWCSWYAARMTPMLQCSMHVCGVEITTGV
jgi:hypothetical protein